MPSIHFIERANNLWQLRDSNEWESGYWRIRRENAQALIGGHIYLHETQRSHSRQGGVILGYRIVEEGSHRGRKVFRFLPSEQHKGVLANGGPWARYMLFVP